MRNSNLNEEINRLKLLINYKTSKTLSENFKDNRSILLEQNENLGADIAKNLIDALSKTFDDDEDRALKEIQRINNIDTLKSVNNHILTNKKMSLVQYINDEMSDVDWQYKSIFDHLKKIDPSYSKGYGENKFLQTVGKGIDYISPSSELMKKAIEKTDKFFQKKQPFISTPKGLQASGPFYDVEGGIQPNEVPILIPFKNNVIIIGSKSDESDKETQSVFIFAIRNLTQSKVNIDNVEVNYKTLSFDNPPKEIAPGGTVYFRGRTITPESLELKNQMKNEPKMGIDNTYVKKQYTDLELVLKDKEVIQNKTNDIIINTSLGKIQIDIVMELSEAAKTQKEYLKLYSERKSIPIELPDGTQSEGGKFVPEYFSPFEYDEFLYELKNLYKECPSLKKEYEKYFYYIKEQITGYERYLDKKYSETPTLDPNIGECNKKFENLLSKYKNDKFPKGITQDDKEVFKQKYNASQKALKDFEEKNKVTRMREPYDQYFDESRLSQDLKKQYDQLKKNAESLEYYYGYDDRNEFEKWFDEWGSVIQIGAAVAMFIGGFFTEGMTWTMMGEVWTWSRFATVVDLTLNLGFAVENLRRGNTKEALVCFVFAGLTQLHKVYDFVKIKTNNLGITNYKKIGDSIAKKLSQPGVSLQTSQEVNAFMAQLTRTEKAVFRTVARVDEETLKSSIGNLANRVREVKVGYGKIPFASGEKIIKQMGGNFVEKATIDMAVTIPLVRKFYDKIKEIFKSYNIDITFGERDKKLLDDLASKLTDYEIKRMELNISEITKLLNQKEKQYFAHMLQNQYTETDFVNLAKTKEYGVIVEDIKKKTIEKYESAKKEIEKMDLTKRQSDWERIRDEELKKYKNKPSPGETKPQNSPPADTTKPQNPPYF